MKCPLCSNTFTTPSLPGPGGAVFMPPPPLAPTRPAEVEPFAAVSPSAAKTAPAPVMHSAAPEPMLGDYRHRVNIWMSPRVLPWIAVAAMLIVFVLMFFPWVGFYPGGVPVATQNAWQVGSGSYWSDPDLAKSPDSPLSNKKGEQIQLHVSGLVIVFWVIFLVALVATLAAAALGILPGVLPGAVEKIRPWRWALVSGIMLLALLFFVLQLLGGFDLTNQVRQSAEDASAQATKAAAEMPAEGKQKFDKLMEITTGMAVTSVRYTCALWSSLWLMLLALISAVLTHFLNRRTSRPLPRIELLW